MGFLEGLFVEILFLFKPLLFSFTDWVEPKSLDDLLVGNEFCGVMTFPDCPSTDCFWFSGLAAIATLLLFLSSSERTGADGVDALEGGGIGLFPMVSEGFRLSGDSAGDKIAICGDENSRILAVKVPPPPAAGLPQRAPKEGL